MIRTQIYFDKDLYTNLKYCSQSRGISMSEYIRQLLADKIIFDSNVAKKSVNPLLKIAKLADKDPIPKKLENISGNVDKYLPKNLR